jgi:hypothetical protein
MAATLPRSLRRVIAHGLAYALSLQSFVFAIASASPVGASIENPTFVEFSFAGDSEAEIHLCATNKDNCVGRNFIRCCRAKTAVATRNNQRIKY